MATVDIIAKFEEIIQTADRVSEGRAENQDQTIIVEFQSWMDSLHASSQSPSSVFYSHSSTSRSGHGSSSSNGATL
jgi:hypothetical protein